jgi:hypothetical protein
MPTSRNHLIKQKSMISKSYSGVAAGNLGRIKEYFEGLKAILTLMLDLTK